MSSRPDAGVDFFRSGALPVPRVTTEGAERIAASFGLMARAQPLGSQQDSNFLLVQPDGAVTGVLKIANPDVVTVAKAMGNGYPLGAVVTSRATAARYRDAGYSA